MDIKKAPRRRPANRRGIKEILEAGEKNMHKVGLWVELKHKQKQEGQYDTMEKSPAS